MNYDFLEVTYPSKDGKHTVFAEIYSPKDKDAKGIIQLAHGMADHVARYEELADFLTGEGYIFAGHHHLGHGKTAGSPEDLGFFADKGGVDLVIEDMHAFNLLLREKYPALPIVVMGHSMGSFITRLYVERHSEGLSGAIIHGTGGKNPLIPLGKLITKIMIKIKGSRHRSKFITGLAFGSYNSKFPDSEGPSAWLTRELDLVYNQKNPEYSNFLFTLAGYRDLFEMLALCNRNDWFKNYPKDLPTLVISGDMDPVGNYGKGVIEVHAKLRNSGLTDLSLKMYEGARHELFKETNRYEVFDDMLAWISHVM